MRTTVGLRSEILLTLSLLMAAALLLGGIMMLRLTEQSLLEQRVVHLNALNRTIVMALKQTEQFDRIVVSKLLRGLPSELANNGWWLYDRGLNLIASEVTEGVTPFTTLRLRRIQIGGDSFHQLNFPPLLGLLGLADTSIHFAIPLRIERESLGLIELQFSLDDLRYQLLQSQKMVIIYVFIYGLILVLIGYYLLQRNVISPAKTLLEATDDVGRGDLERRLRPDGPFEIYQLAEAYNRMVEALQISRSETSDKIDALEKTNQELQFARKELLQSEKLASVGQLAAGLAHELGNPLAALIGYLELLKSRVENNTDTDIVSRSLAETERIDFLIRELLDFSRPAATKTESLDPVQELRKTVEMLRHQGSLGAVTVVDELPASALLIQINRQKLQQVYINLLRNAVQACGGRGKVWLAAEKQGKTVVLSITDNGSGIDEAGLPRIFDPFYTTKEPGEGTGLGLAVCHRIVAEARGKITVSSQLSEGTSFKLEFLANQEERSELNGI